MSELHPILKEKSARLRGGHVVAQPIVFHRGLASPLGARHEPTLRRNRGNFLLNREPTPVAGLFSPYFLGDLNTTPTKWLYAINV